ncbi:MAG: T9SS type A sorting domain-containing protein [Crocinitomicaceae bacterium]|nr:T9SS type A sorting domain-containing protein [Crocinitomicaceae bacterium]MDP4722676.1 T9SS type A sorting domain-containing protein [Crocinitomicaceae bacterium]
MKKLLLTVSAIALSAATYAQVIVAGISPQSIVANYAHTWADPGSGWGTPDFNIPGTYVQDTLMVVDDGSTGLNAQGNPISAEGCNPLFNDLTGKIAVVFRNTCEFGTKAINAQNAGAVGVIVINRNPGEVIAMGAGAEGANVTIPVVMVDINDGLALIAEMANGPVVMFLGNKTGLFPNDGGISAGAALLPRQAMIPSQLAQNGTEFNFDLGARIYNYGNQAQNNMTFTATITNPSGATVYNNQVTGISLASGDSTDVDPSSANNLPNFSLASYPEGTYTLTYTLGLSDGDDYDADNILTTTFTVTDSLFSYAQADATTGTPSGGNYYRPGTNNQTYSACQVIDNANASRLKADGIWFSATTAAASGVLLTGEEMALYMYKWEDVFTDLNDANLAFNTLTEVANGYYYFPGDLQGETVYGAFTTPVALEDNQRYIACVQTVNLNLYMGHENGTNLTWNEAYYLQPMAPNESDGTWYAAGFGSDLPSSVAIAVSDNDVSVAELNTVAGKAFPNPANDVVTVAIEGEGTAQLTVTDVAGKVAMSASLNLAAGQDNVNIASLTAGLYIFNVTLENGKTAQFNVVKK